MPSQMTQYGEASLEARTSLAHGASTNETMTDVASAFTSRGLVLPELLSQVKHFNARMRSSALEGITELVVKYPAMVAYNIRLTVLGVLETLLDVDSGVRAAVRNLLAKLFHGMAIGRGGSSLAVFAPYVAHLVLYISSGMSHLEDSVRLDAVRSLDLVVTYFPWRIAASAPALLDSLLYIATGTHVASSGKGPALTLTGTPSGVASSSSGRAAVLNALETLVVLAFAPQTWRATFSARDGHVPDGVADVGAAAADAALTHVPWNSPRLYMQTGWVRLAQPRPVSAPVSEPLFAPPLAQAAATTRKGVSGGSSEAAASLTALDVLDRIAALMLECWIESDPSSRLSLARASALLSVVRVLSTLVGAVIEAGLVLPARLATVVRDHTTNHYLAAFPVSSPIPSRANAKQAALARSLGETVTSLNVALCSLAAQLAAAPVEAGTAPLALAAASLADMTPFLASLLVPPSTDAFSGSDPLAATAGHRRVLQALPVYVELLLADRETTAATAALEPLLGAVTELLASQVVVADPTATLLVLDVVAAVAARRAAFGATDKRKPSKRERAMGKFTSPIIAKWAQLLFKILWVLKGGSPQVSRRVLGLLAQWALYDPVSSELGSAFHAVSRLVGPLLAVKVKGQVVGGPFLALDPSLQALALHLLLRLQALPQSVVNACAYIVHAPQLSIVTLDTLLEVLFAAVTVKSSLELGEFVSLVVSALVKPDAAFAAASELDEHGQEKRKRKRGDDARIRGGQMDPAAAAWVDKLARLDLLVTWTIRLDSHIGADGEVLSAVVAAVSSHLDASDEPALVAQLARLRLAATAAAAEVAATAAAAVYDLGFGTNSALASILPAQVLTKLLDAIDTAVDTFGDAFFSSADRKAYLQARSFIARGGAAWR
ncbi:testis-expressed sequence 10 protein [Thecamonas trahens ATCC 50062]|uniref:Testis-expressed sequence 10 protein n=1 Tax=Thecamonas trahens ATCC 50062 TaxID=461836 RepID=A0A0L0DBE5_THETB|nr:testis-expressed sequence 10 protein [Thecamonas trahens ATCC 50062]KNC48608.1 testis-expressed sequence 10 protein [Thecamonas trahens ATCC 50062]|eukprot:XP_013762664.1 testis-expressed sequence 10 protein [Thecamonas trahens ATCC 50062]